ncbi:aryldialkylphosphatase [Verrucomicrobia bacterium LW23]|nr:aryldialkylphosphatase [Verrucomicrobia bacterium LW23]
MSFIRTVLGDIAPETLGVCYAHEHIIIDPGHMTERFPEFLIDSVDLAAEELARFRQDGGSAMIDSMPTGGRNAGKLAEVSRRTGVHIVSPTGLHLQKYYPADHWSGSKSVVCLADYFMREITFAINDAENGAVRKPANEAANASPGPSPRAGLIKIASGLNRLSEQEKHVFAAAAAAHRNTGCPILTHTEQGTAALEQIKLLALLGVDLRHVVLSHTDRKPDLSYHREILRTGVRVEFDSAFRWKEVNPTRDLVLALAPEFPSQIMLGMDAARRTYWRSYGGSPGLSFLLTDFRRQLLEGGLREELWERIMVANPAEAFAFAG